jgi:hypothetical protein
MSWKSPKWSRVRLRASFLRRGAEVIRIEAGRRLHGHFILIHHDTGFKADIYLAGADPLHHWALAHRRRISLSWGSMWVALPEYVILRKLSYYQQGGGEKHLSDIRGILKVSGDDLDLSEIQERGHEMGLEKEWKPLCEKAFKGVTIE